MEKEVYWLWLSSLKRIGAVKQGKLLKRWQSAEAIYEESDAALQEFIKTEKGFGTADYQELQTARANISDCQKEWEKLKKERVQVIGWQEEGYPQKLSQIPSAPCVLFVKGDWRTEVLDKGQTLGVVGTRKMSRYGKEMAVQIGRIAAQYGIAVISGMAGGIDGQVQRSCLQSGGYSVGVLGSGLGFEFPASNRDLYQKMEKQGGLLSEEWYNTPPYGTLFPKRNRIISGLSDVVIVVEAAKKSGSLITVDYALEQGKEVYALPGRIGDEQSAGCNWLIGQGAYILEDLEQFFIQFTGNKKNIEENPKTVDNLDEVESRVYGLMNKEPIYLGRLLEKTGMEQGELQLCLLQLEWKGYIEQLTAGYYIIKSGTTAIKSF